MAEQQSEKNDPVGAKNTSDGSDDGGKGREGKGGLTPSTAPNASFETGAGEESTGFDSPAMGSSTLSNEEYLDLEKTRNRSSTTGETGEGLEPGDAAHEAE